MVIDIIILENILNKKKIVSEFNIDIHFWRYIDLTGEILNLLVSV